MPDTEAALDALFRLPIGEFIAARDALAAELKAAGDNDAARRVKKLKKPTVAAWAVNQLPVAAPDALQRLLDASANLRKGHEGGLTVAGLQEAMQARQAAVRDLVKAATDVLEDSDHSASAATMNKVTRTLEALATDDHAQPGRLERELEPKGFEAIAGFALAAPKPAPMAVPNPESDPDEAPAAPDPAAPYRETAARAKREMMRAQTEALEAKKQLEDAQARAAKAATALNEAREKSEAADAELAEVEGGPRDNPSG